MHTICDRDDHVEAPLRDGLTTNHGDTLTFEEFDNALLAHAETGVVAQWPSAAARIADVAAAQSLAERYPDWPALSPNDRAQVLASLRIFLKTCPDCGGPVRIDQEAAESCCREYDILQAACGACLLEMEWSDEPDDAWVGDPPPTITFLIPSHGTTTNHKAVVDRTNF